MMEITLADVETAIKVLTEFLKKQKQAEILLRRMGIGQRQVGMSGLSFEQFVNMAYQQVMEKKAKAEEPQVSEEPQLTEEDLRRMKEIADKLKTKSEH
jgi:adenosylmethionine-8-amino-7-oxononanoate aminotransferase